MAAPLVVVAPLQGFEVKVPAGWEANATWKGIELRPTDPDLRRHLAAPVQLVTDVLEEFYNPAPNAGKDGTYEDSTELPRTVMRRPEGLQSRGSFPEGNRWFRTDLQAGRWRTTQWHISWPYRCEPGVPARPRSLCAPSRSSTRSTATAPPRSTAWPSGCCAAPVRSPTRSTGSPTHPGPTASTAGAWSCGARPTTRCSLARTALWPTSGGGRGQRPTWCPAPSVGRSGSSSWPSPDGGSTCRATAAP